MINTNGGIRVGATQAINLVSTSETVIDSMKFTSAGSIGFRSVTGNIAFSNSEIVMELVNAGQLLINSGGTMSITAASVFVEALDQGLFFNATKGAINMFSEDSIQFETTNLLLEGQNINVEGTTVYISGENNGLYLAGTLTTLNAIDSQDTTSGVIFNSLLIYTPPLVAPNQSCNRERAIGYQNDVSFCICQDKYWRCLL